MATQSFEKALKQLEKIVQELESGDLPLEKTIKKFEEGVALSKFCSKKLEETEAKISQLLQDHNGDIQEEPFDEDFGVNDDIED
ncbi:MAG: exodeoxyribonuclease VII small subunit [Deltaproteobacteria bacterium]|nr:exodeoxyribonuclease VII small subunit [Deltaproteobacteria bacterium]